MERSIKFKFYLSILVSVLGVYFLLPTFWALYNPDRVDQMPGYLPKTAMKLGLDLQGGIHMVLGVDLDKVVSNQLANYGRSLEKSLESDGVKVSTQVIEKDYELEIKTASDTDKQKVSDKITKDFGVLEFVGESGLTLVTRIQKGHESEIRNRALDQSIETIRNRIDEFGVAEPVLARKGDNQILVQFPGAKEPERLKSLIGQTAQLSFQMVHECRDMNCMAKQHADLDAKIKAAEQKGSYNRDTFNNSLTKYRARLNEDLKDQIPADTTIAFERKQDVNVNNSTVLLPYLLSTKKLVSGEYLEDAFVTMHKENQMSQERPVVSFAMNAAGTPAFGQLTTEGSGMMMAIVLDGIIKSAPRINEPLTTGRGIITLGTGGLEEMNREARDLSIVLRAGALPATIEVQEERVIGASMGRDAIESGKKALAVASVLIFLFMWAYYGLSGLVGNVVIFINTVWIFALLGMLGATLTLPGLAGVILTLGMAGDAVIIIFERMREEIRAARGSRQIVELGFDRAFSTILDSNVTTAIGAFVLLQYGTGTIRGFALTLIVGITVNVIMATAFMKSIFNYFIDSNNKKIHIGLGTKELKELQAAR